MGPRMVIVLKTESTHPALFVPFSFTLYTPGSVKRVEGLVNVEVFPFPKLQVKLPALREVFVKFTVSGGQEAKVSLAVKPRLTVFTFM